MDTDHLYEAPLDRFVAERDALAKSAGDPAEARRIKALRKPSLAAWAINQLARAYPAEMRSLVELSNELRGARGESLRELSRERNKRVASLVELARVILAARGHSASATNLERVTNTLQAASVDHTAADDLLAGRLSEDLEPSGFASLPLAAVDDEEEHDGAARRRERAELKKLESAAESAERDADELERAAELAEDEARTARRAARAARRRAEAARAKASAARPPRASRP